MCVQVHQRATLDAIPQVLSTFCLRKGLSFAWNVAKEAKIAVQQVSKICLSLPTLPLWESRRVPLSLTFSVLSPDPR